MSREESAIVLARRYVRDQLATMQKFGARPTLSRARYWRLVRDCAKPILAARKRRVQS